MNLKEIYYVNKIGRKSDYKSLTYYYHIKNLLKNFIITIIHNY